MNGTILIYGATGYTGTLIATVAADQGDSQGQTNLGSLYEHRHGVAQDYAEAVAWYRKAADQGFAPAQYNLGLSYAKGLGVPQDKPFAHRWLTLAAVQGFTAAASARNQLPATMTADQIAEAQRMAGVEVDNTQIPRPYP